MRRIALFALMPLLCLFTGCADQPTAPGVELVTLNKKPPKPPPEPVEALKFISIETSINPLAGAFTCAVEDADGDGVGPVYCWGINNHLSLGLGGRKSRPKTEPTAPVAGGDLLFSEVHLGNQFACAIEDEDANGSGPIYCWGWNEYGQLGSLVTGDQSNPVQIASDLEFFALDVGFWGACALEGDGSGPGPMHCWPNSLTSLPEPVTGETGEVEEFKALVHTSGAATCGIDAADAAWCWGVNDLGQVGNGYVSEWEPVPQEVSGSHRFQALAKGGDMTCGLTAAGDPVYSPGEILCWGSRWSGGELSWQSLVPTLLNLGDIADDTFTALVSGFCALGSSGQAYCWGNNTFGAVGDGTASLSWNYWVDLPTPVGFPGKFSQISDKQQHTCGIAKDDGFAYCWGHNDTGQLGNGTTRDSPLPVKVAGQ